MAHEVVDRAGILAPPPAGPDGAVRLPGQRRPPLERPRLERWARRWRWCERHARAALASDWTRRQVAGIWMNVLIAAVLVAAWWTGRVVPDHRMPQGAALLEVFAVWCLAFLPGWLYVRFLGARAGALWDEYVLNLHRLGIDDPRHLPRPPVNSVFHQGWMRDGGQPLAARDNIYKKKFDAYYGRAVSEANPKQGFRVRIERLFPVFLTTVIFAVAWTVLLGNPEFISDPATVWDMIAFGFLGAYSFIVQMLVRRFFQSDLRPSAYASAVLRVIIVLILVCALHQIDFGSPQHEAAVAFFVGFFPLIGMQALQRLAATLLRVVVPSASPDYPLSQLDGLSVWYEARLLEEGIEDMQNLATANLVDVILHTRVPVGRLVDWVDQAHLYLHLSPSKRGWSHRRGRRDGTEQHLRDQLRARGIRTATDLLSAFAVDGTTRRDAFGGEALDHLVTVLAGEEGLNPVKNWKRRCSALVA